jgi:hypothetical protein
MKSHSWLGLSPPSCERTEPVGITHVPIELIHHGQLSVNAFNAQPGRAITYLCFGLAYWHSLLNTHEGP